ncbi:hypothetical protein PF005_g6174 [Phytophthora fragariae]|uniref:Pectate lyase n=1 Tax=Phytophthora fragariae TaxID=53985 RepID=A0A6A3FL27_9STRA|nr:hypothetical protein PF003_g1425 [Phytophthora fragariae]KAE8946774.1 hypothetical protein PF009_g3588 [Phytophthora fragariae]KAE9008696.1 hypothetical protein PF011_g10602 [Phytophthora fragariae]KAE9110130.1 hypothetical protein PF010_g11280 [Phytophthora fragariae]KAE9124829.1 hypothetical protein PF007_g6570 [Phytophthora fragariae]
MLVLVPVIALPLVSCWASDATYGTINEADASRNWTGTCGHSPRINSAARSV